MNSIILLVFTVIDAEPESIIVIEFTGTTCKVKKILKGSMDLISSPLPSVKIQIMGGKDYLRRIGKTLLGIVNKHLPADCWQTADRQF